MLNITKTTPTPWVRAVATVRIPGKLRKVEAKPKKTESKRTTALIGCRKNVCPIQARTRKAHGEQSNCFGVHGVSVSRLEKDRVCLTHRHPVGAWAVWLKNGPKVFKLSDSDLQLPWRLAAVIVAKLSEYRSWCLRIQRLIYCFLI